MVYKYISSKTVVAKVYADLDLQDDGNKTSDIIEWIGEALEHIGSYRFLTQKVSGEDGEPILKIHNHLVSMPCDLYKLNQIAYSSNENGPWLPMRVATGSFDMWSDDCCKNEVKEWHIPDTVLVDTFKKLYLDFPDKCRELGFRENYNYSEVLEMINKEHRVRELIKGMLINQGYNIRNTTYTNFSNDLLYVIKPGFINTSQKNGYLKLSYSALPSDDDGYPLIPDIPSWIEACYWYVVSKLLFPKFIIGEIRNDVYLHSKQQWNFYSKKAHGDAMAPNLDELESIKNNWNRLIPEYKEHSTFFSTTGDYVGYNNHYNAYRYGKF